MAEVSTESDGKRVDGQLALRKAVVDWLWQCTAKPDGLACDVGMFRKGDRVDVAALWLGGRSGRISGRVFICCPERDDCWPVCSGSGIISAEVVALKARRSEIEERIRLNEPELREKDMLFEEYAVWDYSRSADREYHEICGRIASLEELLYSGSILQHIAERPLCQKMYVVVPRGMLQPDELMDGWGLLWVGPGGVVEEMRESGRHAVSAEDGQLFIKRVMNSNAMARKAFLDFKYSKEK